MAPLKVYGTMLSTCTARVLATLEEKGVEYELVPINLSTGEHKQPPHIYRNPFGQVPALEDGDLMLFESRAISKYVARKFKDQGTDLLRYGSEKEAALVEVWMEVESQDFNAQVSPLIFQLVFMPMFGGQPDQELVKSYVEKLGKVLDVYEEKLKKTKYLAGDFFSLADLHHLPYAFVLANFTEYGYLINSRPHVKAWWDELIARPSCKKVTDGMAAAASAAQKK